MREKMGTKGDLKKHMLFHTKEKPYFCNICQKRFRQSNHLTKYLKGIHKYSNQDGMEQ